LRGGNAGRRRCLKSKKVQNENLSSSGQCYSSPFAHF
jgi:hypothetical protein